MKLGDGEELVVCQFRQQDMKLDPIDLLIDFYIDPEDSKRRLYSKLHTAVGVLVTHEIINKIKFRRRCRNVSPFL